MRVKILNKIFGTRNQRAIRGYLKTVNKINAQEASLHGLSDDELKAKTPYFKQQLASGLSLDDLVVEAFAVVREAARRTLGLRHFDVQCIGGMVLHYSKIAEMRTGEGKTLVATLPAYLNALAEKGVHVITVNDYLAQRDADWMRSVFEFLGMTVGVNISGLSHEEKQQAYACDITYGTNNEFGFDYLRDNMVFELSQRVQRPLFYCIIDEVDSILIDEARTPLIISGQADRSSDLYGKINKIIPGLKEQKTEEGVEEEDISEEDRGDYVLDEKNRVVILTEQGHQEIEERLVKSEILGEGESLYDLKNITTMHYVNAALKAHTLFQRDVHYVVKNGQVIIVDEHTGRLMDGRRWSDGLHQAVESKEGVDVQIENQTLATITFQNYFRLYEKLSGMTGTADTEAFELRKIYGLEVLVIPTNKPMIRNDKADQVFLTQQEKFEAMLASIKDASARKQPVLVGTASIESSEVLSQFLNKVGIKHEVLNAKQHEREASIIANAGRPGAVTIATNMAGRGTDIVLGGSLEAELEILENATDDEIQSVKSSWQARHDEVLQSGGLHVLGAERHESRRIDNQLRGRSGRQGDSGSSQFYLSMEDNLLRIFAAARMSNMMRKLGVKQGDVIEHPWINSAIEKAQRRVESMNFDVRKQLLEFDDVANDQRKVIYNQRHRLLVSDDISKSLAEIRQEVIERVVTMYLPPDMLEEEWDISGLEQQLHQDFGLVAPVRSWLESDESLNAENMHVKILEQIGLMYHEKEERFGAETLRQVEKSVMLQLLDNAWKDHLAAMEQLRQGIHLRGYAQKNPTQEFKRESFEMFKEMMDSLKYDVISTILKVEIQPEEDVQINQPDPILSYHHQETNSLMANEKKKEPIASAQDGVAQESFVRNQPKVGRNQPCPCGSGKKYKQCCGRING
ncbi:MAG: preprotein translocase subunit SecA [Coxiellaceae bacterium]|nr:preprotein translocase subunit SecA [Coxiellaceae bacterium]